MSIAPTMARGAVGGAGAEVGRSAVGGLGGQRAPQPRTADVPVGQPSGADTPAQPPSAGQQDGEAPPRRPPDSGVRGDGQGGGVPAPGAAPGPDGGSAPSVDNGAAVRQLGGDTPDGGGATSPPGERGIPPGGVSGTTREITDDELEPTPREAGQQAGARAGTRASNLPAGPVVGAAAGALTGAFRGFQERPAAQRARRERLDAATHEQMRHNRALAALNNPVTPQAEQEMRNAATISRFRDAARRNPDLVTPETAPFLAPEGQGGGGGRSPLRRAQMDAMRDQSAVARYRSTTTGGAPAGPDDPALSTVAYGSDAAGTTLPRQEQAYQLIESEPAFQTPEFENHLHDAAQAVLPPEQHSQLRDSHPVVWRSYTLSAVMGQLESDPAAIERIPQPVREPIAHAWNRWSATNPATRQEGA